MRGLLIPILAVAMATTGCLNALPGRDGGDGGAGGVPAGWSEAALAAHDHNDFAAHANISTPNFEVVGWNPLDEGHTGTTTSGGCGDAITTTDGRRLAAAKTGGDVAFNLIDVTDPANPTWLGEFIMRTTFVYDVAIAPDGKHVIMVTSTQKAPSENPAGAAPAAGDAAMLWRSACAPDEWRPVALAGPEDELAPRPRSVVVVSVEDPANPVITDTQPIVGVGHSAWAGEVDGASWVVASALGCRSTGVPLPVGAPAPVPFGCPSWAASWHFYTLGADGTLARQGTYTVPMEQDLEFIQRGDFHNDGWMGQHPVTGQVLAYLVGWDDGMHIVDLTDPAEPTLLGKFADHDPSLPADDTGNQHSVWIMPEVWKDGRHYVLLGPELGGKPSDRPTGVVYVIDDTDPTAPTAVAGWTLPHDVTWEGFLQFSTHYVSAVGDTMFVTNYHGGMWAVDIADIGTKPYYSLPTIGVFVPNMWPPNPPADECSPGLGETLPDADGNIVTFDGCSGVYVLRFDRSVAVTPPDPWPLAAPGAGA